MAGPEEWWGLESQWCSPGLAAGASLFNSVGSDLDEGIEMSVCR